MLNVGALFSLKHIESKYDYVWANIISWILSVLWSYYWNNRFVFTALEGQERTWWKVLLKTYASYALTGLVICNVLSYLWVDILGVSKYIAPPVNLVISVPVNFVMNKLWAYKS